MFKNKKYVILIVVLLTVVFSPTLPAYGKQKYLSIEDSFYIKAADVKNSNRKVIKLKKVRKNKYKAFAKSQGKSVLQCKINKKKYKYIIYVDAKSYVIDTDKFLKYMDSHEAEQIIFTTKPAPKNAKDISNISDGSVTIWKDDNTIFVSSGKKGQKIILEDGTRLFSLRNHLKHIDVSQLDTSTVEYMDGMFYKCQNLTTIKGLDTWDTSNVTSMKSMFATGDNFVGNGKLQNLDVSKFNTSKVKDMADMFYGCGKLKRLNVSNWDVSKVKSFDHMFTDNFSLECLDISEWNTKSCLNFNAMFNDCHSIKDLQVEKWDVSHALYLTQMFERCTSIKSFDLSSWNTKSCIGFFEMFTGCTNLKTLNISSFNTVSVPQTASDGKNEYFRCSSGMEYMFKDCVHLQNIYVGSKWSTKNKAATGILDNSHPMIFFLQNI